MLASTNTNNTTATWTTALPDWEERIVKGESLIPCPPLFATPSEIALRVFKELALVDVRECPKIGDVTRDWVYEFVSVIFGAYDPATKKRLIKEFFLLISKKNTKSTLAAGIMLTALILNERQSCELVIVAPTKEVANNSFDPMRDMIRVDSELSAIFNVSPHTKTITHRSTQATLKVIAAESDSMAGVKGAYVLIDELWVFGKRAGASSMLQEATGGLLSRPEGFVIWLTTMSDEPPAGVFKEKLDYARGVRDGKIDDPRFLPVLYEFPQSYIESGEYIQPENWYITNPNLGASVGVDELSDILRKAKESHDKNTLQTALAKHLNIPIGISLRANRWAAAEFWDSAGAKFTLDELIAKSEVITMGGDGGGLDDLLGCAVVGRLPTPKYIYTDDGGIRHEVKQWWVWVRAWCHPIALERRKQDEPRYRDFEADGDLVIVQNVGDDVAEFADIAKKIFDSGKLDRIGLDPAGADDIVIALESIGIPKESKITGVSQGWRLGGYQKVCERKIASGDLTHANQAMMAWCVGNARVKLSGSGVMMSKSESGNGKIDPVIAMLNAVALMSQNPTPPKSADDVGVYF
ncbi:terminase [Moraxella bovoculi]|uniref:terminase large subunit n=1 Tax=Moraxella bovoculi TaxID=386891 RepID=UPI0006248542|nr:terminase large subunit [Moraxella bovoculi]AKG09378.1 terminase [Moraxella bovoculi]AKG13204.1 terminase [Moraxella bovoculi]AKG14234.1 terminase [Moraxella bovoculi]